MSTDQKEVKEFLLKKLVQPAIGRDYNALLVKPEKDCEPRDLQSEKILGYFRCVPKSDYDKLAERLKRSETNYSHLELYGNCPHCEPIYGCCQSATGCGCHGYPTDFIATEKCLDRCSSRLVRRVKELESELCKPYDKVDRLFESNKKLLKQIEEKDAEIQKLVDLVIYCGQKLYDKKYYALAGEIQDKLNEIKALQKGEG